MGFPRAIAMALAGLLNFFMPVSVAINPNCDYYQYLIMGQEYYIYNNEYPGSYGASTSCRWVAHSQVGTQIVIACEDISLPSSSNCNGDRLRISLSGNENLTDSRNYCGQGSASLVTRANALAVGLFSTSNTGGGRFMCSLTAILVTESPPEPAPSVCNCGWKKTTRIVGGVETQVNEFPSMAGLIDFTKREVYCGSSIISDRYVLTAAHCIMSRDVSNIGILVGDHDTSVGNDTSAASIYRVSAFEYHPNYNMTTQLNDLAILRTTTVIKFSLYVGPVCLPFRYTSTDFYGQVVTALGWGQLEYTGPNSNTLQKVDLSITSNAYCAQQHPRMMITAGQICTYAPGKDACQSDSGGPLLWMDTSRSRLQLIGVISYGLGCATEKPGVNTRVTSYISWIVSRTSDANYCIK